MSLKKFFVNLRDFDLAISALTLGILIFITFIGVVARYFFNRPIMWAEEFQLACIVIIVFFGVGAGFRHGSHVAIDFLVERFPIKVQRIIAAVIYIICVAMMLYFFVQSSVFVRQMYVTNRMTNILRIPLFAVYASFPVACILIIANYSVATYRKYIKPDDEASSR